MSGTLPRPFVRVIKSMKIRRTMDGYLGRIILLDVIVWAMKAEGLFIDLYEHSSSTLYYLNGNCTWTVPTGIVGYPIVTNAPNIHITGVNTGSEIVCEVNGTVRLQGVIIEHDPLPPPYNVILDPVNKILQWDHPFLPQLPPLFELVHEFKIMYLVYVKEDGVDVPSLNMSVSTNYFNFTSELVNHCTEYEFVVQAESNLSHVLPSQNSSAVSGFFIDVPSFRNFSAILKPTQQQLNLHITFILEVDCPGTSPTFFIASLEKLGEHRLDLNRTHLDERGGIILPIQLVGPVPNTNNLEGKIYGGNEAGNSTEYPIVTHSDTEQSDGSNLPVIGGVVGSFLLAGILLGMAFCVGCITCHKSVYRRYPQMENAAKEDIMTHQCRAYEEKIMMRRCPAYEEKKLSQ